MPLLRLSVNGFRKKSLKREAEHLCLQTLGHARAPVFYEKWGVPDTLAGRFDCASLHLILLLRHVKGRLAQHVFDSFFSYTDLTLREVGVSDLRVGKQVKTCAKFFYGARQAYDAALEKKASLEEALQRNLYGGVVPPSLKSIAQYVRHCDAQLKKYNFEEKSLAFVWPSLKEE